jgi:DNA-binding phage protein
MNRNVSDHAPENENGGAKKKSTDEIAEQIRQETDITHYIDENGEEMVREPLNVYLNKLCDARGIKPGSVIEKSGISRTYGYQIFNGTKYPTRDKVLQLAFGFEMNQQETEELLKAAMKAPMYVRLKRDAIIFFALNKKLSIYQLQDILDRSSLPLLGNDDKHE